MSVRAASGADSRYASRAERFDEHNHLSDVMAVQAAEKVGALLEGGRAMAGGERIRLHNESADHPVSGQVPGIRIAGAQGLPAPPSTHELSGIARGRAASHRHELGFRIGEIDLRKFCAADHRSSGDDQVTHMIGARPGEQHIGLVQVRIEAVRAHGRVVQNDEVRVGSRN